MEYTIQWSPTRYAWIAALLALGGGLIAAGVTVPWYWLLSAGIFGLATVWVVADGRTRLWPGHSRDVGDASTGEDAALETLKRQYAVGDVGDAEFEHRLEALLENETISDVERRRDGEAMVRDEAEREPEPARQQPANPHKCHRRGTRHHGRH